MDIKSAVFVKGLVGSDPILEDGVPQIVFIGRSNVGKSSVINSLTKSKDLARTSSFPGRTQQINVFLINNAFYLIDLPGYGFAKMPKETQLQIQKMMSWFLFNPEHDFKKVVLIIDANIGPSTDDIEMLRNFEAENEDIIIVANKIDKIKKSDYAKQLEKMSDIFHPHKVIPYSAEKKIGVVELSEELSKGA